MTDISHQPDDLVIVSGRLDSESTPRTSKQAEAERIPAVAEDARQRALVCIDALESHLDGREYLVGGFSAADIMMGYSLALAARVGVLEGHHPRVSEYLERLEERPGFSKGLVPHPSE